MITGPELPYIGADDFARRFSLRAQNLMWLLGAGASASSGVPTEADRRAYLDGKLAGAKPSYGHIALATLIKTNWTRIVWTTNFDALVADACAAVFGSTGNLTTADWDSSTRALQAIQEEWWPVEVKLHGDFRSRRLKNTRDELRRQDSMMRQALVDASRQNGLVMVGCSGLRTCLRRACGGGIEAALVSIDNFDEVMRDLIRLIRGLDTTALDTFAQKRQVWSPAPIQGGHKGRPVIRRTIWEPLPLSSCRKRCTASICLSRKLLHYQTYGSKHAS